MTPLSSLVRRLRPALLGLPLAAALLAGCDKPAEITSYETPQVQPRVVAVDPDEVRSILHHMFAAIVPAGDKAWFFKLVVPGAAAEEMRKPFEDFIATVELGEPAPKTDAKQVRLPTWKLPAGWTEQPGTAMRAATIVVPHGDAQFEIAVSSLPQSGEWPAFLKVNVDRWMGQLQQQPLSAATIDKLARKVTTVDGKATVLELVGMMENNPMGAGMGGMPAGPPPLGEASTGEAPLGPATAPADGDESAAAATEFTAVAPTDWKPGSLNAGMFTREAAFTVATDGGGAELAVTRFPANGQMAALGPNVQRWAGQVGIGNLTDEDIEKSAHAVVIDGAKALQFEFFSPGDAATPKGLLAAMIVRGEEVWFVKLFGDKSTVESQRDAFDAYLKSIRFKSRS